MRSFLLLLGTSVMGVALAAGTTPDASAPPNVHESMKNVVAVQMQAVWDLGNKAMDDNGNADASKLTAAEWGQLLQAATQVKQASQSLAVARQFRAAAPGQKLDGEGNPGATSAQQVQGFIDAKPDAFRAFAQALVASMNPIIAAAQAKDAAKLLDASGAIDQICENCHLQFWYPK